MKPRIFRSMWPAGKWVWGRGYGRTAREAYKNWLDSAFVCGRMTYAEVKSLCAKLDAKRRDKAST